MRACVPTLSTYLSDLLKIIQILFNSSSQQFHSSYHNPILYLGQLKRFTDFHFFNQMLFWMQCNKTGEQSTQFLIGFAKNLKKKITFQYLYNLSHKYIHIAVEISV